MADEDDKKENSGQTDTSDDQGAEVVLEDIAPEDADNKDGAENKADAKKGSGKKKLIIIAAALVLILAGGGGAAWFLLGGGGAHHEEKEVVIVPSVYVDLPEIVVDIKSTTRRTNYIKLTLSFKIPKGQEKELVDAQPHILDAFRSFLRGLTRRELSGQQGTEVLRAELTRIAQENAPNVEIQKILFKDIMVN